MIRYKNLKVQILEYMLKKIIYKINMMNLKILGCIIMIKFKIIISKSIMILKKLILRI